MQIRYSCQTIILATCKCGQPAKRRTHELKGTAALGKRPRSREKIVPKGTVPFGTIRGKLEKGAKTVVVEDLISTGGSVIETVEALREAGAEVLGVVSIFTYNMRRGLERMAAAGVENTSLTDFDTVAEAAAAEGYIAPEDIKRLLAFRDDPSDESWITAKGA